MDRGRMIPRPDRPGGVAPVRLAFGDRAPAAGLAQLHDDDEPAPRSHAPMPTPHAAPSLSAHGPAHGTWAQRVPHAAVPPREVQLRPEESRHDGELRKRTARETRLTRAEREAARKRLTAPTAASHARNRHRMIVAGRVDVAASGGGADVTVSQGAHHASATPRSQPDGNRTEVGARA